MNVLTLLIRRSLRSNETE